MDSGGGQEVGGGQEAATDLDRAAALVASQQFGAAETLVRAALAQPSRRGAARVLLARIFQEQGRSDDAQNELRTAVQDEPTYTEAWLGWAALLQAYGHAQRAEDCLRLALTHLPRSPEVHNDLGLVLLAQGKLAEAQSALTQAVSLAPRQAAYRCNLGLVRGRVGDSAGAALAFREAIALNPALPEAHNGLGAVLKARDPEAATAALRTALDLRPGYAEALDNLGVLAVFARRLDEATRLFDEALAANPRYLRALGHKTTALFLARRLPEAWQAYRRRFEVEGLKHDPHGRFPQPVWHGESLQNKAILVWTELGLGEEILQAGMLSDLARIAARITVECSPRLETLFRRSFPDLTIIPRTNPARACPVAVDAEVQIAGGDLGGLLRAAPEKFTPHRGYLKADPVRAAALRQRYAAAGTYVIGLSWASHRSALGKDKTLALADFVPLLNVPGVVFVTLQYGADPAEIAEMQKNSGVSLFTDPEVDFAGDMDGVAAQVAAMDLVISVSNTTVHLAGALNIPVWNIVPAHNATGLWHWFADSDTSPWYPAMRIYRRTEPTPAKLIETIAADLRARVAGGVR